MNPTIDDESVSEEKEEDDDVDEDKHAHHVDRDSQA